MLWPHEAALQKTCVGLKPPLRSKMLLSGTTTGPGKTEPGFELESPREAVDLY
jgi:hypothetical protein